MKRFAPRMSSRNRSLALLPLIATLGIGGCATYRADPLDLGGTLTSPIAAVLARDAATISRPYLKPVALDLGQPLDANAVAVLAVVGNPDLRALRARANVADAQLFAARLLPDPTISLGFDQIVSGPPAVDNLAGSLAFVLNDLRTRGARQRQARAETERVRLDLAWAEWQTAGQAQIQAARVEGLERSLALAIASRASAQSLLDRSLRAAGRGDLLPDQVESARFTAFDAAARLRTVERDLAAARFELTRLLGLPLELQLRLAALPDPAPPPNAAHLFAIARAQRLDLQALQAGYQTQEAAVRLAILNQFPTLDLTVNAARDTGRNGLVGPSIGFTLPLWNRNRGGIAIEQATRAALKSEYDARLFRTRAEIAAAVGAISVSQRQRGLILADLPALRRFAQGSRRAADRGDLALATAQGAEQALRDKEILLAQAEQDSREQMAALQILTGVPQEAWPE